MLAGGRAGVKPDRPGGCQSLPCAIIPWAIAWEGGISNRPYFKSGIAKLEVLAESADVATLKAIFAELDHRSTVRAHTLRLNVRNRLRLAGSAPTPKGRIRKTPQQTPQQGELLPEEPPRTPPARPVSSETAETAKPKPLTAGPPQGPKPAVRNRPADILGAWTALEALSPPVLYSRPRELARASNRSLATFGSGPLPWEGGGERSRPGKRLLYEVHLGALEAGPVFKALLDTYGESSPEYRGKRGWCPIATVIVDSKGLPLLRSGEVDPATLGVSSFAWAAPVALGGGLRDLGRWVDVEQRMVKRLSGMANRMDRKGERVQLSREIIAEMFGELVTAFGLQNFPVERPAFAVRRFEYMYGKTFEASLLNSFYLTDLAKAEEMAEAGNLPRALSHYLGASVPSAKRDLLESRSELADTLAPERFPLGRWTGPGRHSLAALQQAAVNAAGSDAVAETGMLGVNGPPGTGKTTLLRDVVAARVCGRAEAMAGFKDPADAFTRSGVKLNRGKAKIDLYKLDGSLCGFEMIVASSNNKAVENVSAELPRLDSVAKDAEDLRYFASVASHVLEEPAWGLAAAVLGNSGNRYEFGARFWRDDDCGLLSYFDHAAGLRPSVGEELDDGTVRDRPPRVIEREDPPGSRAEALAKWKAARAAFGSTLEASRAARDRRVRLVEASREIPVLEELQGNFAARVKAAQAVVQVGWWPRPLRWWRARRELQQAENGLRGVETALHELTREVGTLEASIAGAVTDEAALPQPHEALQRTAFWYRGDDHAPRDALFRAALDLHRAFLDAAADPVRQNLRILVESFGTRSLGKPERDAMFAHLWSTFFLVVPVASTTFASVASLLRFVPPESLGWLLVDEAGQAVPQAAAGAMLRCRRAVVVGDPLQVEPVVSLPGLLSREIVERFGVDPARFLAPEASVQTLADAASPFGTRFPVAGGGHREVGLPLLVHRRCDEPMFSISNRVAYGGLMVQAKPASDGYGPLGRSGWQDVRGRHGPDKWVAAEGEAVLEALRWLRRSGAAPDLYIITPFRVVQDRLRDLVAGDGVMAGWVPEPETWCGERIGTVHTVQGREAPLVLFVLGAGGREQAGARRWAGGSPNILNVAVTRAKRSLHVIGNRELWREAGVFGELARRLPVVEAFADPG